MRSFFRALTTRQASTNAGTRQQEPPEAEAEAKAGTGASKEQTVAAAKLHLSRSSSSTRIARPRAHPHLFRTSSVVSNTREQSLCEDLLPDVIRKELEGALQGENALEEMTDVLAGSVVVTPSSSAMKTEGDASLPSLSLALVRRREIRLGGALNDLPSGAVIFKIIDVMERIACNLHGGIEAYAAANLPTLLIYYLGFVGQHARETRRDGGVKKAELAGKDSDESDHHAEMTDESDHHAEMTDDYETTDKEDDDEEDDEEREEKGKKAPKEERPRSPFIPAVKRGAQSEVKNVVVSRISALLCNLLRYDAPKMSLIREPYLGLVRLCDLLYEDPFAAADSGIPAHVTIIWSSMTSGTLPDAMVEHMIKHKVLRRLVSRLLDDVYDTEKVNALAEDGGKLLVEAVQSLIRLLQSSARTSTALLQEFENVLGYRLLHRMVCILPGHVDVLLAEIRLLICLGPGYAKAEKEAEAIGAIHPIHLARNVSAFSIIANLLCQLCTTNGVDISMMMETDRKDYIRKRHLSVESIGSSKRFSWAMVNGRHSFREKESPRPSNAPIAEEGSRGKDPPKAKALLLERFNLKRTDSEKSIVVDTETLRLPLLHCILTIYSANPANFGILDEKFGVMNTLVASLGNPVAVHDEFLFMVIKLLELIAMGMDYQPTGILTTLSTKTLPELIQAAAALNVEPSGHGKGSIGRESSVKYTELPLLCSDYSSSKASTDAGSFITEALCNTITKLLRSDDDYKNVLRNCGLLEKAIFPFIELVASKTPEQKPALYNMLPVWCALLCEMLEANPTNQTELRNRGVHLSLYSLITCTIAEDGEDEEPTSPALNVLLRLASDDSPSLSDDISALLELLQHDSFSDALKTQFKVRLLQTLAEMMRRNDRVKDVFRSSKGFETALAVLMSLETDLGKQQKGSADLKELEAAMPLVGAVFATLTIAMAGNLDNREYMLAHDLYTAIASSLYFLRIIGSPVDVSLVQYVIDCATEDTSHHRVVYLRSADPLSAVLIEYGHLTTRAKRKLLTVLQGLLGAEEVGAINCQTLLTPRFETFVLERLLPAIGRTDDELYEDSRLLIELVLTHQARPRLLRAVIELLYASTPGDRDLTANSNIKSHREYDRGIGLKVSRGLLRTLRSVTCSQRPVTHVCMSGVYHSSVGARIPKTIRRDRSNRSASGLGDGQILVETLGARSWPHALGYSLSMWIFLPRPWSGEATLKLFEMHAKMRLVQIHLVGMFVRVHLCDPAYLGKLKSKRRSRFRREGAGSEESRMTGYSVRVGSGTAEELERGWHHVLFVHTPEKLLDKGSGGFNVYFDSVHAGFVRCPYFPVIPDFGKDVYVTIGDASTQARRFDGHEGSVEMPIKWAVGGVMLLDGPLNVIHAQKLFILGPWYQGAMTCAGQGVRDSRSHASAFLERLHECSTEQGASSVVEKLGQLGIPCAWRDVIHAAHTFFGNHSSVSLNEDNVVLALHGSRVATRIATDETGKRLRQTTLLGIEANMGRPAIGQVEGGASVVGVESVATSLRSMGGVTYLLPLLERTIDTDIVWALLRVMKGVLFGDAVNRYMFRKDKGHFILAWLLFSKREDREVEAELEHGRGFVMTPLLLEAILHLAITGEGRSAVITDPEMLNHVVLNYQVWRGSDEERWVLIELVLQWLANLVSQSNHNKALNCAILQRQNVVGWVLEIMLMLTVDIPSTPTLIVSVLAAALELLDSIVREKPTNRTLYSIFQYILVTLSHSSGHSPSSSGHAATGVDKRTDTLAVSLDTCQKAQSPMSKRRNSVAELVGRTRLELQVNQGIQSVRRSAKSGEILSKIRRMLFQLLMNLPREQNGGTSAANNQALRENERVLRVYAEVLSVRWFASVLDEQLDRETVMLALEVLALSMQVSEDFSHHFISRGGLHLVGRVFQHSEDLPCAAIILVMLLFGIPVSQLPSFVPYDAHEHAQFESEEASSSFISPQTKHQLLRRQSSIRSASSMGMADETKATLEERFDKHVFSQAAESLSIPVWAISVLRCLIGLIQRPVAHADAPFAWVTMSVLNALERMSVKSEACRQFFETPESVQQLSTLIFVEAGHHWGGPATSGVKRVFTSLLREEMAISPSAKPAFRFAPPSLSIGGNRCNAVRLTKTMLDAFDAAQDSGMALKYQELVFTEALRIAEEDGVDKENLVQCWSFWAARASIGWCPKQEGIILDKVMETTARVGQSLAVKLRSSARGLVLWTFQRVISSKGGQAEVAIAPLCASLERHLPTIVGELQRTAPRDPAVPTIPALKALENWIEHNYHLDREEWIFFLCLFLQVHELRCRQVDNAHLDKVWTILSDADKFITGFLLGPNAATDSEASLRRLRENLLPLWQFVEDHVLFGARSEIESLRRSRRENGSPVSNGEVAGDIQAQMVLVLTARKKKEQAQRDHGAVDDLYKAAHGLINGSHHEAADRHLKWQRATLEHLLKGKRYWKQVQGKVQRENSVWRPSGTVEMHERKWELHRSEGPFRMRRRLKLDSRFYERYQVLGESVLEPERRAQSPERLGEGEETAVIAAMNELVARRDKTLPSSPMKSQRSVVKSSLSISSLASTTSAEGLTIDTELIELPVIQPTSGRSSAGLSTSSRSLALSPTMSLASLPETSECDSEQSNTSGELTGDANDTDHLSPQSPVSVSPSSRDRRGQSFNLGALSSGQSQEYGKSLEQEMVDEMVELGWEGHERIVSEIDPVDADIQTGPFDVFNCATLRGLDTTPGICLICKTSLYVMDNYQRGEDNKIEEITDGSTVPFKSAVSLVHHQGGQGYLKVVSVGPSSPKAGSKSKDLLEKVTEEHHGHHCRRLRYDNVRELHRRRHIFREVGIEFFAVDGTDFLIVFDTVKDRDWVFTKLLSMEMPNSVLMKHTTKDDVQMLARSSLLQPEGLSSLSALMAPWQRMRESVTRKWLKGKISNFGYLIYLNTLAGRSFNDLTQYPVFPWVLQDYDTPNLDIDDPQVYRDLSKPMGAINPERAKQVAERYASLASVAGESGLQPFHYGTHYSCSAYVLHFLLRLEPYTRMALELQGKQFDRPDRLFRSISGTWRSAAGFDFNAQDVRELLPEFYFLPEFLNNLNRFEFGSTQRGKHVDNVELPAWAKDAFEFIRLHRKALESSYVSEHLHLWIDLIFGAKQNGKAAIAAQNVFHPLTYEGEVDLDSIDDSVIKTATLSQIHNFGQTPRKLFTKPHPKRHVPEIDYDSVEDVDMQSLQWHVRLAPPLVLPGASVRPNLSNENKGPGDVALVRVEGPGNRVVGTGKVNACWFTPDKCLVFLGRTTAVRSSKDRYIAWNDADSSLALYSFAGSTLAYSATEPEKLLASFENLHSGPISVVKVTDDGKEIWTGGEDSLVICWGLYCRTGSNWIIDRLETLSAHPCAVTHIALSSLQGIALSASEDGLVLMWDLGKKKYVRTVTKTEDSLVDIAVNEQNGNVVVLSVERLSIWTVNASLLVEREIPAALSMPTCVMATLCEDYQDGIVVATGHSNGKTLLWDIIYPTDAACESGERTLHVRLKIESGKEAISCIASTKEQRRLIVGNVAGEVFHYLSIDQLYAH